ncbi:MAG TPA: hypothetical protein VGR89_11085, partial [Puia sp.]|nr:hypothetical protein [Puia sp.]
ASQPDIETTTLGQIKDAGFPRYSAYISMQQVRRLVPSSLLRLTHLDWPIGSYPSLGGIRHFARTFWTLVFPLYLGFFGCAAVAGHFVNTRFILPRRTIFPLTFIAGSCLMLVIIASLRSITAKDLCLAVALFGFSLSSWLSILRPGVARRTSAPRPPSPPALAKTTNLR